MTHSYTRHLICCIALLSASGCKQANHSEDKSQAEAPTTAAALREPTASEKQASENAKRARVTELSALIATAQTQREVLAQQKSNIEAQLATYQADSTVTLDQLKAEMHALEQKKAKNAAMGAAPSSAKQMDAFSERARNQLEHALAMDQEYQTQLAQAADDLRKIDANMAAMRAEVATLQTEIR